LADIQEKIDERNRRGAKFSLIVVAEGARPAGGEAVYQAEQALGGMKRLGGIGAVLAAELEACCEDEVRVTVLGYLQRGGSPTAFDRLLASRFGAMAVHLIGEGKFGYMTALKAGQIVPVRMAEAVAHQKFVSPHSDLLRTATGLGISLGNGEVGLAFSSVRSEPQRNI
jgi:6-phosphofructokinase 1